MQTIVCNFEIIWLIHSQRVSYEVLWCFFLLLAQTNSRIADDLGRHAAHMSCHRNGFVYIKAAHLFNLVFMK